MEAPLPPGAGKSSFDLIDPSQVFTALPLDPASVVLDLACGPGHYALELANRLPRGTVHALDLWPGGIAQVAAQAQERDLDNLHPAVADAAKRLPLDDASIDLVLTATVLHDLAEAGKAPAALAEIARVLRPGGCLAVIEFEKINSHPGPPVAIRLAPQELEALVVPHGFSKRQHLAAGEHLYLVLFSRL